MKRPFINPQIIALALPVAEQAVVRRAVPAEVVVAEAVVAVAADVAADAADKICKANNYFPFIEPVNATSTLQNINAPLGVGIGFREQLRGELFLNQNGVDFLEIIADRYLDQTPEKLRELDLLIEHFTLVPHAINLSLGSAEGIDERYLEKLARLIERVKPPWWSEHICFTKAGGIEIGHLTPLPYTHEAVDAITRNIKKVKSVIPSAPLILENITYMLEVPGGEMSEADFISEIVEKTDCGLLLDVTNLYINSVNYNYNWRNFLDRLPMERVVQLHFVGGHKHKATLIDSHSQQTPNEIFCVMEEVLLRAPVKGAILERDENFPSFDELLKEISYARKLGQKYKRWD